jgi:hypothetical protein
MIQKRFLALKGEITPLTSTEEDLLKGGFGIIKNLRSGDNWGSNNDNCDQSSLSNNDNCKCACGAKKQTALE